MKKFEQLEQFIINLKVIRETDIISEIDNLSVTPAGRRIGGDQIDMVLSTYQYTAVYFISGFPFKRYSVDLLVGQISAWLLDYDDKRHETSEFSVNVDKLDENGNVADIANLEISIAFDEEVVMLWDTGGDIVFNGDRYKLGGN